MFTRVPSRWQKWALSQRWRRTHRTRWRLILPGAILLFAITLFSPAVTITEAASFVVDTFTDASDADTGNPSCDIGDGSCSLRAAIEQAVATAGADTITLPAGTYTLTLGDLTINGGGDLTITGADARSTIINQTAAEARVFDIIGALTVNLSEVTVSGGNLTSDYGAGVWVNTSATANLTNTILNGNNGFEGGGLGAGVGSTVNLDQVQISNNTATRGGGIYQTGGTVTVDNSTISGNTATENGGGIYQTKVIFVASNIALNHVTLAKNSADGSGGGAYKTGNGTFTVRSSLIADNSVNTGSGPDCAGTLTSQGYNLLEVYTGCTFTNPGTDITGDPGLGALANNGGATDTHAVADTSSVVDRIPNGTNGCVSTYTCDQRTVDRADGSSSGSQCDMGAFEYATIPTAIRMGQVGTPSRPSADPPPIAILALGLLILLTGLTLFRRRFA